MYSWETKVTVPLGTSHSVFIIVRYNSLDVVLKFVILIVVCSCEMYIWKMLDMSLKILRGC